jgi:flagellar motor switch protein FliM
MNASQAFGTQQGHITPFHFRGLPVVHRTQIDFFNAMAQLTPVDLVPGDLPQALFESIAPLIQNAAFRWQWTGTEQVLDFKQLERYCLSPTLLIEVAMLPLQSTILLELDPRIGSTMVELALGGTGERGEFARPLSEIERGVLAYLLVKMLHQAQTIWGNQAQTEFRLVRIANEIRELSHISNDEIYFRKELHCSLLQHNGFVRVHIPTSFVTEITQTLPDPRHSPQEHLLYQRRLKWMAETPLQGLFRVGIVDLSEADFQTLVPGDMILLRECTAQRRPDDGLWEGYGILQFSEKPNFAIRCSIITDLTLRIRIEEVIQLGELPALGDFGKSEFLLEEHNPNQGEYIDPMGDGGEGQYEDFDAPVSDIPIPLMLELGSIERTLQELTRLRVGDEFELPRTPHEPLQLIYNNRVMAIGDLTEHEGQPCIKIIELAG